MLLRSISKHIKDQNWFAVFVDFLIVVVGVFIGIQVSNWNAAISNNAAFQQALQRFDAESKENISTMNALHTEVSEALVVVRTAFDTLKSCQDSTENQATIEQGLSYIKGTYGLRLRMNALQELTAVQSLLAEQSEAERARFSELKFLFELFIHEGRFSEERPHQDTVQTSQVVGYGDLRFNEWQYFGIDTSAYERDLVLLEPVSVACKDQDLLRAFYSWERAQGYLPAYTNHIRTALESYLAEHTP
jgi:hypothetical protein